MKILVGLTGSVAVIKCSSIYKELVSKFGENTEIEFVATENSLRFIDVKKELPEGIKVWTDADEWNTWKKRGDPVLHIELRNWANIFLIAPLDANTMAKISSGICDNLLVRHKRTCIVRAWDIKNKPIFACPAMNTAMWNHPLSTTQLNLMRSFGYHIIMPIEKTLMCGDKGYGAMEEPQKIVSQIAEKIM